MTWGSPKKRRSQWRSQLFNPNSNQKCQVWTLSLACKFRATQPIKCNGQILYSNRELRCCRSIKISLKQASRKWIKQPNQQCKANSRYFSYHQNWHHSLKFPFARRLNSKVIILVWLKPRCRHKCAMIMTAWSSKFLKRRKILSRLIDSISIKLWRL